MDDQQQLQDTVGTAPAPEAGPVPPKAPFRRRCLAHAIDLTIVVIVLALFLLPVLVTHARTSSPLLKASAWVYLGVFVILVAVLGFTKARGWRRRTQYVTVGMSIMDVRALRVGETTYLVDSGYLPTVEGLKRGRAAATAALPLILLGVVFLIFELISYS